MAKYTTSALKLSDTYVNTLPYNVCLTAADTAAKAVSAGDFSLETGATVIVKFNNTNSAENPTLNVSDTGAKPIYHKGSVITPEYLKASYTYTFIYNGAQWDVIGEIGVEQKIDEMADTFSQIIGHMYGEDFPEDFINAPTIRAIAAEEVNKIQDSIDDLQPKTDENLSTVDKTITGSINELNSQLNSSADNTIAGTWVFNDEIDLSTLSDTEMCFISNGSYYGGIKRGNTGSSDWGIYSMQYTKFNSTSFYDGVYIYNPEGSYGISHGWQNGIYKTIEILEEPTDETFITWLRANASKQPIPVQKIKDSSLTTNDKTIVGAINELNSQLNSSVDTTISGTWVFNDIISRYNGGNASSINFTTIYDHTNYGYEFKAFGFVDDEFRYNRGGPSVTAYNFSTNLWFDERYKTITITEEPIDETFVAWLKINAIKKPIPVQKIKDSSLNTTDKTIVGAINEVNNKLLKAPSEGLQYAVYTNENYIITGLGTCTDTDIIIPSEYNGFPVVAIGASVFAGSAITSINIPITVQEIYGSAFENCNNLKNVYFPPVLNCTFYEGTFAGCTALEYIEIPQGITNLPDSMFYNCANLKTLVLPNSLTEVGTYVVYGAPSIQDIYYAGTASQWNLLMSDIADKNNENFLNATIHTVNITDNTLTNGYGTCATTGSTQNKTVYTTSNWVLKPGSSISVYFNKTNTAANPTLNVNSTGAKSIKYNNVTLTTSNLFYAGYANRVLNYIFNGTEWVFTGWAYDSNTTYSNSSLGQGFGVCSTSGSTALTASITSYSQTAGGIVSIQFNNPVPANATLNINGTGALPIHYKGVAITAGIIKANDTATFMLSSSNVYHLIAIDSVSTSGTATLAPTGSASEPIYIDENGQAAVCDSICLNEGEFTDLSTDTLNVNNVHSSYLYGDGAGVTNIRPYNISNNFDLLVYQSMLPLVPFGTSTAENLIKEETGISYLRELKTDYCGSSVFEYISSKLPISNFSTKSTPDGPEFTMTVTNGSNLAAIFNIHIDCNFEGTDGYQWNDDVDRVCQLGPGQSASYTLYISGYANSYSQAAAHYRAITKVLFYPESISTAEASVEEASTEE